MNTQGSNGVSFISRWLRNASQQDHADHLILKAIQSAMGSGKLDEAALLEALERLTVPRKTEE